MTKKNLSIIIVVLTILAATTLLFNRGNEAARKSVGISFSDSGNQKGSLENLTIGQWRKMGNVQKQGICDHLIRTIFMDGSLRKDQIAALSIKLRKSMEESSFRGHIDHLTVPAVAAAEVITLKHALKHQKRE